MMSHLRTVWVLLSVVYAANVTNALQSTSFVGSRLVTNNPIPSSKAMLLMQMPIVDNWKVLKSGELVGTVRNHPVIDDGDTIKTSTLAYPEAAVERKVVMTTSGSKYKLGEPSAAQLKANGKAAPKKAPVKQKQSAAPKQQAQPKEAPSLEEALRRAKSDYGLTGKSVGEEQYLLAGKPIRSTSGKSNIYTCYKSDEDGLPVGEALCAKISPNIEALRRESNNYGRVTKGLSRGQFVRFIEFFGRAGDDKQFNRQCVIIMEKGEKDLKAYIEENGPLAGKELRVGAVAAIQCLQAMHSANLVWTDLKAENFVVTSEKPFAIKGIDLESAMSIRDNPVDYSPEACPPEFAKAFLAGDGPYFVLECSYDVWSLGMVFYELSTGKTMFSGKSPAQITKILKDPYFAIDASAIPDDKLRDLVQSCLEIDPRKRPSIGQILLHPFFLTTGFGPFSF
jgi:serine/threonine protein kinase